MEHCFHREIALLQQKNLKLSDLLPVISFQDVLKNSVLLNCMEKKTPRYILRILIKDNNFNDYQTKLLCVRCNILEFLIWHDLPERLEAACGRRPRVCRPLI